jgi:3-(3-hydroxy-phenyl)propionate hydroxylase
VGDSAHQVSPFGARGGNSGIQDADNLCWKLALVLAGQAPDALLDTYDRERAPAARENIRVTTATTDFMSAKGASAMAFRDAVLELAETTPCARAFVNSGRLSLPAILHGSSLDTPDRDEFSGSLVPGAPAADAPIERAGKPDWLLDELGGTFALIVFGDTAAAKSAIDSLLPHLPPLRLISIDAVGKAGQDLTDVKGIAFRRYDAEPGSAYLLRPDQHVAARWRKIDAAALDSAFRRALGFAETTPLGMALTGD